jgi:hypothetical protein
MKLFKKLITGTLIAFMLALPLMMISSPVNQAQAQEEECAPGDPLCSPLTTTAEDEALAASTRSDDMNARGDAVSGESGGGGGCSAEDFDCILGNIEPAEGPQDARNAQEIVDEVAKLASKTHRFFMPLINFFSFQIGNFLGNDYIYNGAMGEILHRIWITMRNIVNIIFVFVLLWMAIKEIFAINQESELRKNLVVFVLLLVAVNFTWLATKVVLDAANVATHVVFAIPSGISGAANFEDLKTCKVNINPGKAPEGVCFPSAILAPSDSGTNTPLFWDEQHCAAIKEAYSGTPESAYKADGTMNVTSYNADGERSGGASEANKNLQRRTSICMENLNLFSYDQNTAVIYLTYGAARIQNLIFATNGSDAIQLAVGVLMSLIIQIAYTVALFAFFVALVLRMAFLWLLVAFSPLLVLLVWFKDSSSLGDIKESFSLEAFINWAFAPVKVGAVLSVSFIMISAGQAASSGTGATAGSYIDKVNTESGFLFKILEPQSLFMGTETLQNFIWLLITLVVLWMGVFAVLTKVGPVQFQNFMNKIKETGVGVATAIGTSPYYAPILPLGKGGAKQSVAETFRGVNPVAKLNKEYSKWTTGEGSGDSAVVTKFKRQADAYDYRKIADILRSKGTGWDRKDGEKVAQALGFNGGLKQMMKQDKDVLEAGFKTMNNYNSDGKAGKLYEALQRANGQIPGTKEPPKAAGAAAEKAAEAGTAKGLIDAQQRNRAQGLDASGNKPASGGGAPAGG